MYLFLKTPSGYMPCYRCYDIILARPHLTHKCCLPYIILPYLTCVKAAHSNRFVQHLCCLPSITFSFALLSLTLRHRFQEILFSRSIISLIIFSKSDCYSHFSYCHCVSQREREIAAGGSVRESASCV
jgi:hypothetical protein